MARTNVQRVDESIAYIKKNHIALAGKFNGINKEEAGKQISLAGHHYIPVGWAEQHKAVRALLLCQYHFLGDVLAFPKLAKRFFKSKSKTEVDKYIRAYMKENPLAVRLAEKAESYTLDKRMLDYYKRNRDDNQAGGAIVCYTGVMLWLFQAGFLTMKGFKNINLNAVTANKILGKGKQWNLDEMDTIPRGHIWNFQGVSNLVCHWGVSLGNGNAAATNNALQSKTKKEVVNFESGGKEYGRFTLKSMYEVLKIEYGKVDRKQKDPFAEIVQEDVETKLFVINPERIMFSNDF